MANPFDRWTDRIVAADDETAQRALLTEIGRWRAMNLTDVPAQRDAAFGMARLHMVLGDRPSALREAQSLVSLCQTPPQATPDEFDAAAAFLTSLGGTAPTPRRKPADKKPAPAERGARRGDRPRTEAGEDPALAAARGGRWEEALRLTRGRGPRAALFKTWVRLARALSWDDPKLRHDEIVELEQMLRRGFLRLPDTQAEAPVRAEPTEVHPLTAKLAALVGSPIPSKRDRRIRLLENHAAEHPEQLDELASLALEQHVAVTGPNSPAPWLVGLVAQSLAAGGAATRRTIDRLRGEGAFAVTAYAEWPFQRMVEVIAACDADDWQPTRLRRGLLKQEPTDRRAWNLRLMHDFRESMLVVAPPADAPWPGDVTRDLARRIVQLSPRSVLWAPGPGNQGLRDAAAAVGVVLVDGTAADALAALAALPADGPVAPTRPGRGEPAAPRHEAEDRGPSPFDELEALLRREGGPDVDSLLPVLARFRRMNRAFSVARTVLSDLDADAGDAVTVTLLAAMDRAVEVGVRLGEGTSMLVRAAARQGVDGPAAAMLAPDGRFGGPGVEGVVQITAALAGAGWTLDRILRGPTRRERKENPVLDALGAGADALWRLVVTDGTTSGEVWYLGAELDPEGKAAIPTLLLSERSRAVVLPVDPALLAWWSTTGGPEAIGWTGEEGGEVVAAVQAWKDQQP